MDQDTNDENLLLFATTKVKEQNLKRNYDKFISRRIKEDLNEQEKMQFWPKYLGSPKIECQLYQNFEHLAILVKSGQIIRFKPRKIQWHSKN